MKNRNKGQIPEEYIDIEAKAQPIEVRADRIGPSSLSAHSRAV